MTFLLMTRQNWFEKLIIHSAVLLDTTGELANENDLEEVHHIVEGNDN